MRYNPKLHKKGKSAYLDDKPLKGISAKDIDENTLAMGPTGRQAEFIFGIHRDTHVLYFLLDSEDMPLFKAVCTGKNKKYNIPIFHKHRIGYGPGTIEQFWKNPITKKLAGAIQFYIADGKLVITHMAVKPAWRRQGLNSAMINLVAEEYAGEFDEILFDEPTDQGARFMRAHGYKKAIGPKQDWLGKYGVEWSDWEPTYEQVEFEEKEVDFEEGLKRAKKY